MEGDGQSSSRSAVLMIQVGVYLFVVSLVAVGLWWLRMETLPSYQRRAGQDQILKLKDRARGGQPVRSYHKGEWVRVRDFAAAKTSAGTWVGVEEDSVLVVRSVSAKDVQDGWLLVSDLERPAALPLTVHTSFVERYEPAVLEGGLELSGCRVRRGVKTGGAFYSVSGWLRNGTEETISQCEVVCQLRSAAGEPIAEVRSIPLVLNGGRFGEFETSQVAEDVDIAAFSLRVRYERAGQTEESSQAVVSLRPRREVERERSAN